MFSIPVNTLISAVGATYIGRNTALAPIIRCPACGQNELHVMHDTTFSGTWHYCYSCHCSGKELHLVQLFTKKDAQEAANFLYQRSTGPSCFITTANRIDAVDMIKDDNDFWQYMLRHAFAQAADYGLWDRIAAKAQIPILAQPPQQRIVGQLIGIIDAEDSRIITTYRGSRIPRHGLTRWIVIPTYDLPGRVSTLTFLSIADDKLVTNHIASFGRMRVPWCEGGFWGLDLLPRARQYPASLVVMPLLDAINMQLCHLADHADPLPIVGVLPSNVFGIGIDLRFRGNGHWRGREVIFAGDNLDDPVFRKAAEGRPVTRTIKYQFPVHAALGQMILDCKR